MASIDSDAVRQPPMFISGCKSQLQDLFPPSHQHISRRPKWGYAAQWLDKSWSLDQTDECAPSQDSGVGPQSYHRSTYFTSIARKAMDAVFDQRASQIELVQAYGRAGFSNHSRKHSIQSRQSRYISPNNVTQRPLTALATSMILSHCSRPRRCHVLQEIERCV